MQKSEELKKKKNCWLVHSRSKKGKNTLMKKCGGVKGTVRKKNQRALLQFLLKKMRKTKILFLDIETVGEVPTYDLLSQKKQEMRDKKTMQQGDDIDPALRFEQKAGIYAEFGKIVCISCGYWVDIEHTELKKKSFVGDNEKELLREFRNMLSRLPLSYALCAHNGKEFDFPYLARRMVINEIPLPFHLRVSGKKPRETSFIDTMELRKFGDYKNFTSLELLAITFGIPSPKNDINGSDIHSIYRKNHDLEKIRAYCEKDVETLAKVYERIQKYAL